VSAGPPVIVLGAERSGTSVCAEMVHAWGAYAGEPGELAAADELNAHGRWEFLPLWDLLAAVGGFGSGATWWQESFQQDVAAKALDPHSPIAPGPWWRGWKNGPGRGCGRTRRSATSSPSG
jgi:hypothetical protein